jgi:hypothetical protein
MPSSQQNPATCPGLPKRVTGATSPACPDDPRRPKTHSLSTASHTRRCFRSGLPPVHFSPQIPIQLFSSCSHVVGHIVTDVTGWCAIALFSSHSSFFIISFWSSVTNVLVNRFVSCAAQKGSLSSMEGGAGEDYAHVTLSLPRLFPQCGDRIAFARVYLSSLLIPFVSSSISQPQESGMGVTRPNPVCNIHICSPSALHSRMDLKVRVLFAPSDLLCLLSNPLCLSL